MGFQVEDGGGTGRRAKVNNINELKVRSTVELHDFHINKDYAKVWSLPFENVDPAGDNDYVFYLKNTGNNDVLVTDVRIMAETSGTQISLEVVDGTASGGTAITPVNRTVDSSVVASVDAQYGTDITGLTSGGILFYIQCDTVNEQQHLRTSSNIRLPKTKAVALKVENGNSPVTGVVSIVEAVDEN